MKILVDVNLTKRWCALLGAAGWESRHWLDIGDPRAPGSEILQWTANGCWVVFTNDLDFSAILAVTGLQSPSVARPSTFGA